MAKTYNLFISHSWSYSDEYEKLMNLIGNGSHFNFNNYSVPKDDPIHDAPNPTLLYEAIKRKISPCHVVIILAGVYASYSKWIDKEITICKKGFTQEKPILAVAPWGAEKTSQIVKNNADLIVKWNTESIIAGIIKLG
ncbi:MAG: TIR domain-containing protein [Deltaproteobacteria bacterium]|nr:TIR domain-containing protein [Deltaproteobacteria bacterium]